MPDGDILIHAGDVTNVGEEHGVRDFVNWFAKQPHKHKIFIAGNHDWWFEESLRSEIAMMIPPEIHYLQDEALELEGLKFWGTPQTPRFMDWAFNRDRGPEIARYYKHIPLDTDILISHGPPFGILDNAAANHHVGCEELLKKVKKMNPKLHVFGHIHEDGGRQEVKGETTFVNASVLNEHYKISFPAQVFTLKGGN